MTYKICTNCAKVNYKGCCPIMAAYMDMNNTNRDGAMRFSCASYEKPKEVNDKST